MRTTIVVGVVIVLGHTMAAAASAASHQHAPSEPAERGLHGFVCGPEGKPLPSATVWVNLRRVTTSEDGTFFVPHDVLEHQGPTLVAMAEAEQSGRKLRRARFIEYVTGRENATIRLSTSASISGRIVTPESQGVEGARVSALMDVGGMTCHGTFPVGGAVATDRMGRFTLSGLYPDTRYWLRVTCPGRERKMTDWVVVGMRELGGQPEVVLRDAPGSVAGVVVDEEGEPVAKAKVILGHPCIPDAVAPTDEKGRFQITDLVPGEEVTLCLGFRFQKVKVGAGDLVLVAEGDRGPVEAAQ